MDTAEQQALEGNGAIDGEQPPIPGAPGEPDGSEHRDDDPTGSLEAGGTAPALAPVEPPQPDPEPEEGKDPSEPTGRLTAPENTNGVYAVLWARKPNRGDKTRPRYSEAMYVAASSPQRAKAIALEAPEVGPFLKARAAERPGILLRAVPAMHWPADVDPTTFFQREPVLSIG